MELCPSEALAGSGADLARKLGPDMTQLDRARSGRFLRTRRRHDQPDGRTVCRLGPDHGLEHGRVPSGQLPLRHAGKAERGQGHPRRSPIHPHIGNGRRLRPPSRGDRHRLPGRSDPLRPGETEIFPGVCLGLHQRGDADHRGISRHRGSRGSLLRLRRRTKRVRPEELAVRCRAGRATR
jgi:hypothetical protein